MANLSKVRKTSILRPPKIIIYGPPGIGKSTFCGDIPDVLALNLNDGLDGIEVARYPVDETTGREVFWSIHEVIQALSDLYNQEHGFKGVMLDSLSDLERLIWYQVCLENNVQNIEAIGYGKGYKYALTYWQQVLSGLEALRNQRNMVIAIIGHTEVKRYDDPLVESYDRYRLKVHEQAAGPLIEWADAVLFADQKVFSSKKDVGFKKQVTMVSGAERVLYTREDPRFVAKNRYGLPFEIPLDWNTFISTWNVSSTTNHAPDPVEAPPVPEHQTPALMQPTEAAPATP